jgi:drug/metabolite transporter (DMT)-like permease
MRRVLGVVVSLVGAFFAVGGVITTTGLGKDADMSRSGMVEVGLAFAVFGLFLLALGWSLFKTRPGSDPGHGR